MWTSPAGLRAWDLHHVSVGSELTHDPVLALVLGRR